MQSYELFPNNINISDYIKKYRFEEILNFKADEKNIKRTEQYINNKDNCVDPNWEKHAPLPPQFDDLVRLHYLVISRKVLTVMEFGMGRSTVILADALRINRKTHEKYVKQHIRRKNCLNVTP